MSFTAHTRLKVLLAATLAAIVSTTSGGCGTSEPSSAARWGTLPITSSATPATTSSTTENVDYSRLLLEAGDVSIPPDTFTARSTNTNPDGMSGASALFVNADETRAIADTILIYPDVATASATLRQASAAVSSMVTGGAPQPYPVGTDGTVISGTAADGSKAVTLLLFTQGRALVRLEFDSATGDPTPPQVVTSVGTMQQIALRVGLPEHK